VQGFVDSSMPLKDWKNIQFTGARPCCAECKTNSKYIKRDEKKTNWHVNSVICGIVGFYTIRVEFVIFFPFVFGIWF
jgi:hypothetical protein